MVLPNARASYAITSNNNHNGSLKIQALDSVVNSSDQSVCDSSCTTSEDIDGLLSCDSLNQENKCARFDSELSTPSLKSRSKTQIWQNAHTYGSMQQIGRVNHEFPLIVSQDAPSPNRSRVQVNGAKYIEQTIYCSNCSIAFMPSYTGEREFCSRGNTCMKFCLFFLSYLPQFLHVDVDCETSLSLERRRDYASNRQFSESRNHIDSEEEEIDVVPDLRYSRSYRQDGLGLRIRVSWEADSLPQPPEDSPHGAATATTRRIPASPKTTTPTARIRIINKEWQGTTQYDNRKCDDLRSDGRSYVNYPTAAATAKR